ncbi:MAG: 2-amino-4-hydroxy-6-hydroxymethyldihydropteridine diphosphokinase [Rhodobacteraceae bacterium]|nr:2-amino-4-hydroxy-6-hydroxymethyldihydropteridine diphosphokinase [Paracoccaceae bacterium]MAY46895.1 2-amino-4-hydroxy-6-hydroxymethyldihydropteridine diphosphokinase [Paracoccaceae bacterium]QEW22223.1 2-amino-4-hydroxy-6- hydroxymethyldihydropteridine pyrophosphokinase [Marinibacterium anthonyi]
MTDLGSSLIICLGANLPSRAGPPAETLRSASRDISRIGIRVTGVSRFFSTPCFPAGAGPDYVNAALIGRTGLAPEEVLAGLHDIEGRYGRNRKTRWGQRTLDLDLAAYDTLVRPDLDGWRAWMTLAPKDQQLAAPDRLILPHPRMQDRAFVLVPLCDIAPDWRHPVLGKTAVQMAAELPLADRAAVVPL